VDDREVGGGLARGDARLTVDDESSRSEEILGGRQAGWRGGGGCRGAGVASGETETNKERGRKRERAPAGVDAQEGRKGRRRRRRFFAEGVVLLDERVVPESGGRVGASAVSDAVDAAAGCVPARKREKERQRDSKFIKLLDEGLIKG
jgi:hypothetical protein